MKFSPGDKVVHPHHGPGVITAIETCELMDEPKPCYVFEIPDKALKVFVPLDTVDELGMRRAMSRTKLTEVMRALRSKPKKLDDDYKVRQEQFIVNLRTRQPVTMAKAVRDLSWRTTYAKLTQKDRDLLRQGKEWLAAEIALVSGDRVTESNELISTTIAAAIGTEQA
jgi:CarD family transcriptional regulator